MISFSSRRRTHPLVSRIDRIAVRAEHPERLFALLTDVLGLPVVAPTAAYPGYAGGSVALGNMILEVVGSGPTGISLAPAGRTLAEVERELDEQGIPHSAMVTFYDRREPEQPPVRSRASVFLGGFLGDNLLARGLFLASRLAPNNGVQRMIGRGFPDGAVFFTEYGTEYVGGDDREPRAYRPRVERWDGGPLGVLRVREVRLAVPDVVEMRRRWSLLLDPTPPVAPGWWRIGDGPALRLSACYRPSIQLVVVEVRSLAQAHAFLGVHGLLGFALEDEITLALPQLPGLAIRLVEGEASQRIVSLPVARQDTLPRRERLLPRAG